jgi:ABC-type multidrug transport system fused ATPase/permease subunit
MQLGMIAANRVFDILDTEDQIQDTGIIEVSLKEISDLKKVRFGYIPDEEVIKGIDLVNAGQTIAIVGSTGAGKSTIINLLNRFYEISGSILLTIKILRIIHCSYENKLQLSYKMFSFFDTIFNNITLNNAEISREQVLAAAKK